MSKDILLVVDDHYGVRQFLSEFLSQEGFRVKEASDGYTALQIIIEEKPKLTFLDLKMPGLSGIETLNKIKQLRLKTQVVVMSGSTQDKALMTAIQKGHVKCFFPKPFDLEDLRFTLHSLLCSSHKGSKLRLM
ncbi:response regulator [Desulfosporosinus sp.]|uniref:response regulator n=1 Tax=Desulfosporosinus sp. TaxID=157907 RepID=UPI0025C4A37E|nr:response regulator [Desulfosporosinus sp.]MBC2728032.1 response regulator [Desulfosporosinus sp.]